MYLGLMGGSGEHGTAGSEDAFGYHKLQKHDKSSVAEGPTESTTERNIPTTQQLVRKKNPVECGSREPSMTMATVMSRGSQKSAKLRLPFKRNSTSSSCVIRPLRCLSAGFTLWMNTTHTAFRRNDTAQKCDYASTIQLSSPCCPTRYAKQNTSPSL